MKATELRIGNWINTIEGPAQVKTISEGGIVTTSSMPDGDHLEFAEPIPLTEAVMFRMGFSHVGGYLWYCKEMGQRRFISNHLRKGYFEIDTAGHQLHFVHQLQNLYFALTGKELEINL